MVSYPYWSYHYYRKYRNFWYLVVIVTVFRYKAQVQLEISQKILEENDGVFSSGKINQIVFETFLLLIQPYSFLNGSFELNLDIYITSYNIYDNFEF